MPDFAVTYADFRTRVQTELDAFLGQHAVDFLRISPDLAPTLEALTAMLGGGKRLRPAFCYWGHLGAGGSAEGPIVRAAASLELLQASALIHDDVMDNSDMRRGMPAVHRRFAADHLAAKWRGDAPDFGRAAAILIGDLALVWTDSMLLGSGFDDAGIGRARVVFDAMRMELMAGQFLDVLEQARGGGSVERARRVMRFKTTAYTIERPLHLGAALAEASSDVIAAYSAFGVPLGEAFQLRDDVLGVFGNPATTGKPAGDDLREGKRTVLLAIAQQRGSAIERAVLDDYLGDSHLDDSMVSTIREILITTGALSEIESRISELRAEALTALDRAPIDAEARLALRSLALAATERTA